MRKIISNLSDELQKLKENAIKEAWSFKSKSKNLPEKPEENTEKLKEKMKISFKISAKFKSFLALRQKSVRQVCSKQ